MSIEAVTNQVEAAGSTRTLNVRRDLPDFRDRIYEPALIRLEPGIDNRKAVNAILDQGAEGSCTGHGLAAVINLLKARSGADTFRCSRRMLYEMARKHDEWPGEDYEGSSCRGAIRGWKNMGVCTEAQWPYQDDADDNLTIERAIAAREHALGAYYRLRPEVADYHAAINEVGAIFVSARVHEGWLDLPPTDSDDDLVAIEPGGRSIGGHAFAIVGYDRRGFIVQNSWGKGWGSKGFALWTYRDWQENISDGWVFRLALPTPEIFGLRVRTAISGDAESQRRAPRRLEIAGHFAHYDNGYYDERGSYWSTAKDIERTADLLADRFDDEDGGYRHLLIYAHGGLNGPKASARRIAALKDGFKRNGIYPFHIMYDTGLGKELTDAIQRALRLAEQRSAGFVDWVNERITDITDRTIEDIVRRPGTAIWNEIKSDASWPFESGWNGEDGDGLHTIETFASKFAGSGLEIHLLGHSAGSILLGHLLNALDALEHPDLVGSCSLMAPACSVEFYERHFRHRIDRSAGGDHVRLPVLDIYNLTDELERDDNVAQAYRKSLLYLVSRAFERQPEKPILGMQKYSRDIRGPNFFYSHGTGSETASTTHDGFDNDPATLNRVMRTILGEAAPHPFTRDEMEGY